MFDLFETGRTPSAEIEVSGLADAGRGIVAGTRVATTMGWRPVEALASGDLVLTFDHGMQPLRDIRRRTVSVRCNVPADWPIAVPAGRLGNRAPLLLMPEQPVVIESDLAETLFGDPFVLISAADLDGCGDIGRIRPDRVIELVNLGFDDDQVVFANSGAMFLCPAGGDLLDAGAGEEGYLVLPPDMAATVIAATVGPRAAA